MESVNFSELTRLNQITTSDDILVIGDTHGNLRNLKSLLQNTKESLGAERFQKCFFVFLGDYVDRGEDPKALIDFLIDFKSKAPNSSQFLMGNHDLAFGLFLSLFEETQEYQFANSTPNSSEGVFPDSKMHLQGRRWGGSSKQSESVYNASATFKSYGVKFSDRTALEKAVPDSHKQFLQELDWVTSIVHRPRSEKSDSPGTIYLFVHAGLTSEPLQSQLKLLSEKKITSSRIPQLSERGSVSGTHWQLPKNMVVVSGHHGYMSISSPQRLIIDHSGGHTNVPLQAVLLPERKIFSSAQN